MTCTGRDTKICSHANTSRDTKTETATLRCKESNFVAKNKDKGVIHIVHIRALSNYASVWSTTGMLYFCNDFYNLHEIIYNCSFSMCIHESTASC